MTHPTDPITLAKNLIKIPSITPDGGAVLDYIESELTPLGFVCTRQLFEEEGTAPVDNLFARLGTAEPHLMFAGHVDVVPTGDVSQWTYPPFEPTEDGEYLYGRGTEDMKGAIGCFMAAVMRYLNPSEDGKEEGTFSGSISFLLTADEEGPAINGSRKLVPWLKATNQVPTGCIVGEPTNPSYIGEMVKIGRRGSLYFSLKVTGKQGHVAYPDLADNPVTMLANILADIKSKPLDNGTEHFLPTGLEITALDTPEGAHNVIPEWASAHMSVRYNTEHTAAGIAAYLSAIGDRYAKGKYELVERLSGEPFLTPAGPLSDMAVKAVKAVTGHTPDLSTTGGTSDARFIKDICPVIEFGTTNFRAHHINERVKLKDLEILSDCYEAMLKQFFQS